jgi:thiamine biosynthesis lipoprotein ApbE
VLVVTVAASSATEAEVLATSLFLSGCREQAVMEADAAGVSAVLMTEDGAVHLTGALA